MIDDVKTFNDFEDFMDENLEENILFPWENEMLYSKSNLVKFEKLKNRSYFELKNSSEDLFKIIGLENEKEWFDLINELLKSIDMEDFEDNLISIKKFLSDFRTNYNEIYDLFNL